MEDNAARMNIVITGHVDHGKSTLVGRLLADTLALPEGKLESVKAHCKKNGRVFEYAYLLDALDDEQKQGITIDSARIFFKSKKREYIIIDAPGHIEFLRNMLSGASRAEAAVLVIDAVQGVAENSRRHGLLLSLLGINDVIVAVNKLDALDYSEDVFRAVTAEYGEYLAGLGVFPRFFVPVSARNGVNITKHSEKTPWYKGLSILDALDNLKGAEINGLDAAKNDFSTDDFFAMPVQDIYRFSDEGDERRIYAGTVVSGKAVVGDSVQFLPSGKKARIKSIEVWQAPSKTEAAAREAAGLTLQEEIYVKRGEVMIKEGEKNGISTTYEISANLIWLGERPFTAGKKYLLKLGAAKVDAELLKIERFLGEDDASESKEDDASESGEDDASESGGMRQALRRHDCGSVILRLNQPIACTVFSRNASLGRFVIVDGYDAAGCGIVTKSASSAAASASSAAAVNTAFESGQTAKILDFEEEFFALLKKYFPHRF